MSKSSAFLDKLFTIPPYDRDAPDDAFVAAVNDCMDTLRRRFPQYAAFVEDRCGGRFPSVSNLDAVNTLPALFLPVLKAHPFEIPDDVNVAVQLTSSGTSGQPSVIPLDDENMQRRIAAMRTAYEALDILATSCKAIAFLMDPATTQMAGSIVIDAVLRSHDNVKAIHYLAKMGEAGPEFDADAALANLQSAMQGGPILAVGYPALIAAGIQKLRAGGVTRLPLPEGSRILTGGGWKSFLPGVRLDQAEFRQLAADFFGLAPTSVRDMFGLSECPAVFVQCEHGSYHVPNFAWAQAIDPETHQSVADGETGLLQLTVPLTTCYPLLKILTTDKVAMQRQCKCGRAAPRIVPRGRVSAARFETCAMKIGRAVA